MPSIFSKIIAGEIPAYKLAETANFLAFLDISPVEKGHALVIPKKEVDYIFDLEDEELAQLHLFAKKVALAMEKVVPCKRIGMAVVGLEVPHVHIHLIPLQDLGSINFTKERVQLSQEEFANLAQKIQLALAEH
ncbi:HIT family hydrolase, diadenosine tetraphosphate hydrolase [Saprospira grandis DSM 2844]|uniref:HIT family hydrolase, diadenosine tetraphosphate hydrolase n=1 Tax=Saprospira grandis DSM 2844 TaxID=694433 RepID=J0NZX0_9BACT|nr:HIT family protein [Saprospira grandis]EJF53084.1 HIT family hydrolase, diadenosine tetraphosphate hydrolase [Saprospira grandis DSM 2844]